MQVTLRDVLTKEWFKTVQSAFLSRFGFVLESVTPEGKGIRGLSGLSCMPYFCQIIRFSRPANKRCKCDRVKWINLAYKRCQPYVGICHAGIVTGCVPVVYNGRLLGGIFFGKCLDVRPTKNIRQEFQGRFKGYRFFWTQLYEAAKELKVISEGKLVKAGAYLQSQLNQYLVPEQITVLQEQKRQKLSTKNRIQRQLLKPLPRIEPASSLFKAVDFMTYNYDLQFKLRDLACLSGLSVFRFSHLFREKMGMTPVEYITQVRIRNAMWLLETTDWNCRQIMESIGYQYHGYYIRMFKRLTGMTPEQYRKRKKLSPQAAKSAKNEIWAKPRR